MNAHALKADPEITEAEVKLGATVSELMNVREAVIKTMDDQKLTREVAVDALDAMASETIRVLELHHKIITEEDDVMQEKGSLAAAYFDAISN